MYSKLQTLLKIIHFKRVIKSSVKNDLIFGTSVAKCYQHYQTGAQNDYFPHAFFFFFFQKFFIFYTVFSLEICYFQCTYRKKINFKSLQDYLHLRIYFSTNQNPLRRYVQWLDYFDHKVYGKQNVKLYWPKLYCPFYFYHPQLCPAQQNRSETPKICQPVSHKQSNKIIQRHKNNKNSIS